MLKKLDGHVVRAIVSSTLVVLFALLSIDMLGKIIAEIDILGDKDYTFWRLLAYVLGLMPLKLAQFFPMALLIGALMGLGRLAAGNELTVMQTAGVSRLRIGVIGFLLALVLGGMVLLITEFGGMALKQQVSQMRAKALGEITRNYGSAGMWAQDGNHFINVKGVKASGALADINIYSLDDNMQIKRIRHAHQQANGIRPTSYSLTFWQRLFIPLSTGVMFLLALPFVFGSQRNSSQGRKLFIGVMFGLAYYVSYTSIANIILLTGAPIVLGAIIPIVLFALVSFILLWARE